MIIAEFLVTLFAFYLFCVVFIFSVQIFVASPGSHVGDKVATESTPSFVVIIPAHNEEQVIASTLDSILPQLRKDDFAIVVGDNCTDKTTEVARSSGVTVIERSDELNKGKGYALQFGLNYLETLSDAPDFVIFVDADCLVKPDSLIKLVAQCVATGRPSQALYLMKAKDRSAIKQNIAEFAWIVKNKIRPLGLLQLGMPCQLMGTGMVFPLELIKKVEVGTSHIVEDMRLGIDLARQGLPPLFCPDAVVESFFPADDKALETQRTRWEHGHLGVTLSVPFGLIILAVMKRNMNLMVLALDLLVPPISFLTIVMALFTGLIMFAVAFLGLGTCPMIVALATIFLFAVSTGLAWFRFAREIVSLRELLCIPVYILKKIPLYLRFWVRRETKWVRTGRDKS